MRPAMAGLEPSAALSALRGNERAQAVNALFDRFLRRHGHRCMPEAEFLVPRWAEAPEQVMEMIQGYLRAAPGFDPAENEARQCRQREETQALVESRLNPFQRAAFRRSLASLQEQVRVRDNGQHYLVKLFMPVRRLIAELGKRWCNRAIPALLRCWKRRARFTSAWDRRTWPRRWERWRGK